MSVIKVIGIVFCKILLQTVGTMTWIGMSINNQVMLTLGVLWLRWLTSKYRKVVKIKIIIVENRHQEHSLMKLRSIS